MTAGTRLTPGRLTALWLVLRSLARLGGVARADELLALASRSALRCGGLPVRDGLQLAREGEFIEGTDELVLAPLGEDVLARSNEEEPNTDVLRLFTSVLVLRNPPMWVAYWQGDPGQLPLLLTESEQQVLRAADLTDPDVVSDLDAWAWWSALRTVPQSVSEVTFWKEIGDAGEELSLQYERRRLEGEGFPELARRVRWVARESPAYGFDILSFCGSSFGRAEPHCGLAVEVKAMARAAMGQFRLHLTINEFDTSTALGEKYVLHLWDGVRGKSDLRARSPSPVILRVPQFLEHLPISPPCRGDCTWESAVATIPLS